jgi:hypothetical protein
LTSYPGECIDGRSTKHLHYLLRAIRAANTGTLSYVPIVFVLLVLFQPFVFSSQLTPLSLPIVFETNMGQVPPAYQVVSRRGALEALFSSSGVDMYLPRGSRDPDHIGFHLVGARSDVFPEGRDLLPGVSHYLLGADPSRWIRGISNHSEVVYSEVYPGVDLIFHGSGDNLEHDFRISPGADPVRLRFSIVGARSLTLTTSGDLEVSLRAGTLIFHKPLTYQESTHGRETVESRFVLNSDSTVQFRLGPYDRTRGLVIDPVFGFSTYLAGNSGDYTAAVTSDSTGNIYVTGYTYSSNFPIEDGVQATYDGSPDAFVSKLDPTGHTLLYSTYIGGSSENYGNAIAVDSLGNMALQPSHSPLTTQAPFVPPTIETM